MKNKFVMTRETLSEFETYSAKIETLRNIIKIEHYQVWQNLMEGEASQDAIDKAATLIEVILELAEARNDEISMLLQKIKPLTQPEPNFSKAVIE